MILSAQVWVQAKDIEVKGRISCELLEQIQHTLEQAGIDMPYRHLQLHLDEAKALAPWLDDAGYKPAFKGKPGQDLDH